MFEITHRTVQTHGIHLHIAEAGQGPLVLLLHGWPESWYSWRHQIPVLEAEFEADVEKALRTIYTGTPGYDPTSPVVRAKKPGDGSLVGLETPSTLPAWLTEEDLAYFVKEFSRNGFRSSLNRLPS